MQRQTALDVITDPTVAVSEHGRADEHCCDRAHGTSVGTCLEIRGGATTVLEGEWDAHRLVIVEFPDMASLLAWYHSPEYAPLKAIRERCADTRMIALEGMATPSA